MPSRRIHTASLFVLLSLTACATGPRLTQAPAKVDALVASIEALRQETERSRATVGEAFTLLEQLAQPEADQQAIAEAYTRYVRQIEQVQAQIAALDRRAQAVQTAAGPVFDQWTARLDDIESQTLRQRSEERLARTRTRFDAISTSSAMARQLFTQYLQGMRDRASFLAFDLNAEAIAALREEMPTFQAQRADLDRQLGACTTATTDYVTHAAATAAPAAPAK